jgi:hypothetical protein
MQRLKELLQQKKQLNEIKQTLDKDVPMDSWEGATYSWTLVKLVLIELEIEEIEKRPHCNATIGKNKLMKL